MLKNLLKSIALKANISVDKATSAEKLSFFFDQIRPVTTDKELVRVGHSTDAGYLLPNDFDGITTCFSPGVCQEAYFENDLSRLNIKSFMADYSVDQAPIQNENFHFIKKFIGFDNSPNYISLEKWVGTYSDKNDNEMILQMDIEGSEYNVLIESSNELLKRFRIMIVEFHDLDQLFNAMSFEAISSCFYKLLKDFYIVHIHPNNASPVVRYKQFEVPPTVEFTFLRKDRVSKFEYTTSFPHKLDNDNISYKPKMVLPKCFYTKR